jgi:DNA-binding SARP family transcriptional activator
MILCAKKGMRNEALKVYEACKKALRDEIDTEPDQATTSIYNKIRG